MERPPRPSKNRIVPLLYQRSREHNASIIARFAGFHVSPWRGDSSRGPSIDRFPPRGMGGPPYHRVFRRSRGLDRHYQRIVGDYCTWHDYSPRIMGDRWTIMPC